MVSIWYPTNAQDGQLAQYMTPKESELLLREKGIPAPPDALSKVRTNAYKDAAPAGDLRDLPLVVLSPGFMWQRTSLTSLAEELASRGHVVAAIDHTYENFGQSFPDGRVTECVACEGQGEDVYTRAVKGRAKDVSFVLNQLLSGHARWKGAALIDPSRVAMAGTELGGATVSETMLQDRRVRAGVNLDGHQEVPIPQDGLKRPFMFLGQPTDYNTWTRDWPQLKGWKRWLGVEGAVSLSFYDYDALLRQAGVDLGSDLPGDRSVVITRAYVGAFMDQHLHNRSQPLLDAPSADFPEVKFKATASRP
ncbi:alpha/beta hydrolase family protein [Actinomadura sp. 3N508]|uniref:alpha/beta hydrolase family protein n=1 Tax=Actinomadura sp. 3N508 TaxID=3375153 RepID=UPI0037983103